MDSLKCSKIAQKPYKCLDTLDLFRTTCLRKIEDKCLIRFLLLFDNIYPIASKICSYLPYMELLAIQGLSDSWRIAATIEISKRNYFSWMLLYLHPMTTKMFTSEGFDYAQKVVGFLFSSGGLPQVQVSNTKHIKRRQLLHHLNDDILRKTVINLLFVRVPSNRLILPFSLDPGRGIPIGTFFFLPEIPSIKIKHFLCCAEELKQDSLFERIIDDSDTVECLIVFGFKTRLINEIMVKVKRRNRSQCNFCGCKVSSLVLSGETCIPFEKLACVAFISNGLKCNNFTSAKLNIVYTNEAEVIQGIYEVSYHFSIANRRDVYAFLDNKMRFLTCLCCRKKEIVVDNSSSQGVPNRVVMQEPKKPVDRTVSVTSNTLSMKSFYSVRSLASGAEDFQSICSADSFQSVRP